MASGEVYVRMQLQGFLAAIFQASWGPWVEKIMIICQVPMPITLPKFSARVQGRAPENGVQEVFAIFQLLLACRHCVVEVAPDLPGLDRSLLHPTWGVSL